MAELPPRTLPLAHPWTRPTVPACTDCQSRVASNQCDKTCLRHSLVDPIVLGLAEELEEEVWAIDQEVIQAIPSGLEDGNRDIGVLSQSGGDDESCCSTTTDDKIVFSASKVLDRHGAYRGDDGNMLHGVKDAFM
jgi:hypothetical protein